MSPIQWDGIHAYILLPREFKRQRRSSRLKAIQSLFFLFFPTHSEPSNSKTQMCTIIYEAVALPILLRCCALCPLTFFFFLRSAESRLMHCFLMEKFQNVVCCAWVCHWRCVPSPVVLNASLDVLGSCGHRDHDTMSDSLVSEPTASYLAFQTRKASARPNCPLLFHLQRLNAFVPSKTELQ